MIIENIKSEIQCDTTHATGLASTITVTVFFVLYRMDVQRAKSPSSTFLYCYCSQCTFYFIFYNLQLFRKSSMYTIIRFDNLSFLINKGKACKL